MTDTTNPIMEFLLNRRSRPYVTLDQPIPTQEELQTLLTAAVRCPDHGQLEPWRFIVIERKAMPRIASVLRERGRCLNKKPSLVEKACQVFECAPLIVAVVAKPNMEAKIPLVEQTLSAGAVCLSLLNAALASGWGANWLTGFGAHDADFRKEALGLSSDEAIAGFIHIGTERSAPQDRPRPDLRTLTTWIIE